MKIIIIALLAMTIVGCVHTNNALEIFDKNNTNTEFRGILDVIKNTDKNINILFVHGMRGYSETDGVTDPCKVAKDIEQALGIVQQLDNTSDSDSKFCRGSFYYNDRKIVFHPNFWGTITSYTKFVLQQSDNAPKIERHRSKTTTLIKQQLFNDGFADAVMYTGEAKQAIKDNVAHSIQFLNRSNENAITIIVTFSLGSKIVIDTVNEMNANNELDSFKNSVEMIYLMANQIPLINTGDGRIYYPDEKSQIDKQLTETYEQLNILLTPTLNTTDNRIKIVAFTDPNDLLSYTLSPKAMGSLSNNYVNVGISVATETYYLPFNKKSGIVNYLKAHTGYVHNDKLRNLLMNGNEVAN